MSVKQAHIQIAQELFALHGKTILSAREIIDYVQANYDSKCIPSTIWKLKSGRGEFDISSLIQEKKKVVPVVALPKVEEQQLDVSGTISRFKKEGFIPQVNPKFVKWGNYSDVEKLVKSKQFFSLYIYGMSGTGKNEMISQACANSGRPMIRVQMTKETTEEHLVGTKTLVNGNVLYEEGPIVWAAKNGAIVIIDEVSAADSNNVMCLQNILEGGSFFVKSLNEMITPVEGFAIVATDNTKGRGDETGRYIGTNIQNDAFLDRFDMMMEQTYPDLKTEREIMKREMFSATNGERVDEEFIERLSNWVLTIRNSYLEEAIDDMITTRRSAAIIKTHAKFFDAKRSIELCINRFDDTTKEAFLTIWDKLEKPAEEPQAEAA